MEGTFRGKIKDIANFVEGMTSVAELIDEGIFIPKEDGMRLLAADRAMVSVVDFLYKRAAFDEYNITGNPTIPVNIPQMLSVVKRFAGPVTLSLEGARLKIFSEGDKEFNIPLLGDISQEDIPPVDSLAFAGDLEIEYNLMREVVDDIRIITDSIVFNVKPDIVSIDAGSETSSYKKIVPRGKMSMSTSLEARARFSLDYMDKMTKGHISDKLRLSLAKDHPLRIVAENDEAKLIWIVAPRVESEE